MTTPKILIADASEHDRQKLSSWLSKRGYEVLVATDGPETVNIVRSHQPDLVLLNTSFPPDVTHGGGPFGDAFLVMNWLKHLKETGAIRFLLITDEDAAKIQEKARASGAKALFQKPIDPEALLTVIQRVLGDMPQETVSN